MGKLFIVNNYSPKWRWIAVDIYELLRRGKYPPLFTNTEANNCFRIYKTSLIAIPKWLLYFLMKWVSRDICFTRKPINPLLQLISLQNAVELKCSKENRWAWSEDTAVSCRAVAISASRERCVWNQGFEIATAGLEMAVSAGQVWHEQILQNVVEIEWEPKQYYLYN